MLSTFLLLHGLHRLMMLHFPTVAINVIIIRTKAIPNIEVVQFHKLSTHIRWACHVIIGMLMPVLPCAIPSCSSFFWLERLERDLAAHEDATEYLGGYVKSITQ